MTKKEFEQQTFIIKEFRKYIKDEVIRYALQSLLNIIKEINENKIKKVLDANRHSLADSGEKTVETPSHILSAIICSYLRGEK